MKTLRILFFLTLFALTACNGSDTTVQQVPYSDPALVAKVDALTKALAAATHEEAQKFSRLQLFAGVDNSPVSNLMVRAVQNGVDFGPCTDAGVKIGGTVNPGSSALDEQTQAFKQAPTQTCPGVYAEYDVTTGNLHTANRVFFTSPDCSGNPLVWDSGGQGYDPQKLPAGIAFINPINGNEYWVSPGTSPQMTQAQSVFILANGFCTLDGDDHPMWEAVETSVIESGVPLTLGAAYQLSGL